MSKVQVLTSNPENRRVGKQPGATSHRYSLKYRLALQSFRMFICRYVRMESWLSQSRGRRWETKPTFAATCQEVCLIMRTGMRWFSPLSPSSMLAWRGAPPELSDLVRAGGPPLAIGRSNLTVAWLWAINVDAGSRFRIKVVGRAGNL